MPHSSPSGQRWLTLFTAAFAVLTVLLGGIGLFAAPAFDQALAEQGAWAVWTDLVFSAASLLAFAQPAKPPTNVLFGAARLMAIGFALSAAFAVVLGLSRSARIRMMLRRIGCSSKWHPPSAHAVIVGTDPLSQQLIHDITSELARHVIAVASDGEPASHEASGAARTLTLPGDARDASMRRRLHLDAAKEVFITGPDDAVNLDIAGDLLHDSRTGRLNRADDRPLPCYVHVGHPVYASLLRGHDLFQAPDDPLDVHIFNVRERAARELLLDPDRGLATRYMPSHEELAHYVLVGFRSAGQAVALEAARLAHFSGLKRLRMTIIDDFHADGGALGPADEARRHFLARYPAFCPDPAAFDLGTHARSTDPDKDTWHARTYRPACDQAQQDDERAIEYVVNAEFLDQPAEDPDLVQTLFDRFTAEHDVPVRPAIVVCFDDDGRSFRTAYRLKELLDTEAPTDDVTAPIFVYLPVEKGLAELIDSDSSSRFPLYAFGSRERVASYAQVTRPKIQALARGLHENYRRQGGDAPPWERLSYAFRLSNEDAAAHATIKLRTAGYRWRVMDHSADERGIPANQADLQPVMNYLARMEHNRFVAERLLAGWRYEAVPEEYEELSKDERTAVRCEMKSRKRRPSITPFDTPLLDEDVPKDHQQIEALPHLLDELGETLEPLSDTQRPAFPTSPRSVPRGAG